jgi:glycolate oxidase FAD binding subunit
MMRGERAEEAMFRSGGGPTSAASPATSAPALHLVHDTRGVADAIREAGARLTPLRIRAGGGWLDAGRPLRGPTDILDVSGLRGIVEYTPGDLTITARAATTLSEIDEATRPHGQWLPLDPFGAPSDTLGATLATASCGPLAATQGLPRDLALGVEFVDGRGVTVRGGGRVVKNVAGFDLVRLTIGAWGTLGVITEVTMRLRARPEHVTTVGLPAPRDVDGLAQLLRDLRSAALTPLACELIDAPLARALGVGSGNDDVVLVRLAGNASALASQRMVLHSFGSGRGHHEHPDATWEALQRSLPGDAFTLRCSRRPSELAALWHDLAHLVPGEARSWRHASVERGVVRLTIPRDADATVHTFLPALASRCAVVGERLPADAWAHLPAAHADRLSRGVQRAFDPSSLLNPGLTSTQP